MADETNLEPSASDNDPIEDQAVPIEEDVGQEEEQIIPRRAAGGSSI